MKYFVVFLTLCSFSLPSYAQKVSKLDSVVNEQFFQSNWHVVNIVFPTFNADNAISQFETWSVNQSTGERRKLYRTSFDYRATGDTIWDTKTQYTWDATNNNWRPIQQYRQTYMNGKFSTLLSYNWNQQTQAWVQTQYEEYTYNGQGNLATGMISTWKNNAWSPLQEKIWKYGANGHVDTLFYYSFPNGIKTLFAAAAYTTDGQGRITEFEQLTWIQSLNRYSVSYVGQFDYSAKGNLIENRRLDFDQVDQKWVTTNATMYEVNESIGLGDVAVMEDYYKERTFYNPLLKIESATMQNGALTTTERSNFYYSTIANGVDPIQKEAFDVFPNPTSSCIHLQMNIPIELEAVEMYSLDGKKMRITLLNEEGTSWNLENAAPGVYLVLARFQDGSSATKRIQVR